MARQVDDSGFWLPAEFLTDDDLISDFKTDISKARRLDDFSYVLANSYGFNSDLSSPTELVTSPTETESEDDDLVSELTRKLARSTLRSSDFSSHYTPKAWKPSGSPQSTLCGCKLGPTGSPNSVSGVCSPPEAEDYLRRNFLYAAAEEVARIRMIEETAAFYSSKLFPPHVKPSSQESHKPCSGFYPNQARPGNGISFQMFQAAKMKQQQQMMKSGFYGSEVPEFQLQNGRRNCHDGRARGLSMSAWPGAPESGSGKRAVYLEEPMPKKERAGTGVFLPKPFGSIPIPAESRKKSGCSPVNLPEKVVQALNIDVESIDALQRSKDYATSNSFYDATAALKNRNNVMMAQRRRNLASPPAMNQHLGLPREWTY